MEGIDKNEIEKEIGREPNAENPFTLLDLKLTHVESKAAGVPAVLAAFSDLFEENTSPWNAGIIQHEPNGRF